ncbi:MAG: fumarate reductase subunit A [Methanobrevibacter sp.]|jgi:fumarate reductase (CoM/CoB) subunit A|nr:fumarate reductase subunit A [Candidatus Methanovirga aequatorialis]
MESEIIQCDVLIVGSGGAGCRAAIEVSKKGLKPLIVSKGLSFRSGCTGMAEGGYNAAFAKVDKEDKKRIHYEDTIIGGSYLNDHELVEILVDDAPDRLIDLENYGALFDRQTSGEINQRSFGGQKFRRTCFQGDRTGHEIMMALKEEITKENIETMDEVMISSLVLSEDDQKVVGGVGLNLKDSKTIFFQFKSVILCTGGAGQLFHVTSNTLQKNGDGFALAWNVGADLIDMEQIQFHPTGMVYPESKRGILVTEAVRGEGGILLNKNKQRFMKYYDDKMELATRDVVARAIYNEIKEGRGTKTGGVYLDVSNLPRDVIEEKLETMLQQFLDVGVDISFEAMEVAPTAHHFMGGIKIDKNGASNVKNLFAAGEVTGGVHGANRLGGNALADTQVFGRIAGISASKTSKHSSLEINKKRIEREELRIKNLIKKGKYSPHEIKTELNDVMWNYVSIIRNEEDLKTALAKVMALKSKLKNMNIGIETRYNRSLQEGLEIINMIEIAILVIKSAILRRESRGAHFREDYPMMKKEWRKSIVMNKKKVRFVDR